MKKERIIKVQPVKIEQATILIEGDGDLVPNGKDSGGAK